MSGQVRRSLALALVGLLGGLGLVAALFGGESLRPLTGRAPPENEAQALADPGALAARQDPSRDGKTGQAGALPRTDAAPARDARTAGSAKPAAAVPRFDIVRVEPNGDTVVAGRGAPDAVVEMLVDGKPVARATADADGQFAVVPPALPAGSSQIRLRMTGKDGRAAESEQSVAVEVAPGRDRQPLVALTAPDAATVVLSQPGAPGAKADAKAGAITGAKTDARAVAAAPASTPGPGQPTRIASVDVQENGRLFITATGTPGAAIRLYLNDTLIAPGRVGLDGRASFTIGRGVKPGQYQVRIDQIDPATGKVETRAEVPLSVPEPTQIAAREVAGSQSPTLPGHAQGPTSSQATNRASGPAQGGARVTGQGVGPGVDRGGDRGGDRGAGPGGARADRHGGATVSATVSGTGSTTARPGQAEAQTPAAAASGSAAARNAPAEASADGAVYVPEISTAKITRGDNLWRISQRTYGRGERYTVIYDANQTQIRNPDLIYPGQIFVLPADRRG